MKKLLITIALFALIMLLTACSMFSANEGPQAIEISAEDLWNEFAVDKDVAAERFDGNLVVVTGIIAETAEAFMGSPCILLENGVDSIPDGIFCHFPEEFNVHNYSVGEAITITGTCSLAIHTVGDDTPFISIKNAAVVPSQ